MLYMYKSVDPSKNVFRIAFPSDILTLNPFMATDLRSIWVLAHIRPASSAQTRSQSSSLVIGEVGDLSRRAQLYFLP
jgi:hypothetical protein